MATNLPSCFSIQLSEQLLKFLVNFTFLKYVKSQRNYGFLITKELIFGFQILDLKDHFSASLTVLAAQNNSKIINNIPPTVVPIGRMAEWSKALVSDTSHVDDVGSYPTLVILHGYKLTILLARKQFENHQQHTFNCVEYMGRKAEFSLALVSGTSHFYGVHLNPTPVMLHCYKLTVLLANKQFNND